MAASRERRTVPYGAMDMPSVALSSNERELVELLRRGDEEAFMALVERLQPQMLRVARMYVSNRAAAEEVVQDAWLAVLRGIDRFEGRSSLRTWIFRIVANLAKTRGQREARSVPFSSLSDDSDQGVLDPAWFQGSNDRHPGGWVAFPQAWSSIPEDRLLNDETLQIVRRAIDALPPKQATVIRMRDVLGMSADEVRNALDLTETNQRVLLHRARSKVRRAVDRYLEGESRSA
jgi:RNA polymerase sigma-70 factor, ECF subfamily